MVVHEIGNDFFQLWVDTNEEGSEWNKFIFNNDFNETVDLYLQNSQYITELCFNTADEAFSKENNFNKEEK